MTVSPVTGASTAAAATPSTQGLTNVDSGTFLQLLVAQLKYQDPMNPAQGTEFLAQTAQFTMVEKLNALATQSSDALAAQRVVEATGMVGKTVSYTADDGSSVSGAVTGVKLLASGPLLTVGGKDIALASVLSVSAPPA